MSDTCQQKKSRRRSPYNADPAAESGATVRKIAAWDTKLGLGVVASGAALQ